MTSIDFHSNVANAILYCCRLARKARAAQCRIVLLTADRPQLNALDQALWTFSEHDFLPHVPAGHALAAKTPIILTQDDAVDLPHHDILVNLSGMLPNHFARFERMIEVVGQDAGQVTAGRERFRHYRERGYPLQHFIAESA